MSAPKRLYYLQSIDELLWMDSSTQLDQNEDLDSQVGPARLDSEEDSSVLLESGVCQETAKLESTE